MLTMATALNTKEAVTTVPLLLPRPRRRVGPWVPFLAFCFVRSSAFFLLSTTSFFLTNTLQWPHSL
jgi:hypothetical protein